MTDSKLDKLKVFAEAWNVVRMLNEISCANEGFEIIMEMCSKCIEDRECACTLCKDLHHKLDLIEDQMPRNLLMDKYKFTRTRQEQDRLLGCDSQVNCCNSDKWHHQGSVRKVDRIE